MREPDKETKKRIVIGEPTTLFYAIKDNLTVCRATTLVEFIREGRLVFLSVYATMARRLQSQPGEL